MFKQRKKHIYPQRRHLDIKRQGGSKCKALLLEEAPLSAGLSSAR